MDDPILNVIMIGVGLYVFWLWRQDYAAERAGKPNGNPLPGARPASVKACVVGAAGALVLLALETWGEIRLGLSDEQSTMTALFAAYTLVAAFVEELIFRGFLVVEDKGKVTKWLAALGASLLFAAIHPFLWTWGDDGFAWKLGAKGWFSTGVVFASSLWFYALRFNVGGLNPNGSLIPCIVAHAMKNAGVIAVKGAQGFLGGWW